MPSTLSNDDKQTIVADLIARQDHIRSLVWQEIDRASTTAARLRALNHARRAELAYMALLVSLGVIGPVEEKVAPAPPEPLPWDAHTRDRIARALLYSGLSALPEPELDDDGASSLNR